MPGAPDLTDPRYSWFLIERIPVPQSRKKHDLSRDSEVEQLSSEEVLGREIVQAPLNAEEVEAVRTLPHVYRVHEGGYAQAFTTGARPKPSVTPGLAMHGVPEVWSRYTGSGVKVGVLDTGLDSRYHRGFFEVSGESFVAGEAWDSDPNGHGSHVAGTACYSDGHGGVTIGAAISASVWAGKVLSDSGSGSYAAIIKGLERAVAVGCKVINLSLGGSGDKDHPLSLAVDAASRHTVVCVASGNEQRGSQEHLADQSTPASSREAVTVGAVDSQGQRADFSNIGDAVDLCAHGVNVPSLGGESSGTSMALPHAAGVAALLLETSRTPQQVKQALLSGATNTGLDVLSEGYGILSAPGALERLTGTPKTSAGLRELMSRHMRQAWREWKSRPKAA